MSEPKKPTPPQPDPHKSLGDTPFRESNRRADQNRPAAPAPKPPPRKK